MSAPRYALALLWATLLMAATFTIQLDPSRVSDADFAVVETRTVNSQADQILNLSINVSLPYDAKVTQSPPSAHTHFDEWGNPYLSIWDPHPSMPYTFLINSSVHIQSEPLSDLPSAFDVNAEQSPFLRSSPAIPSSRPEIARLARSITANSTDHFDSIVRLANYVHHLIRYDPSMVDQRPNVSQILARPQGVCTEYSLLFVTLARASGYPARFVGGYAYSSDSRAWQGHSWAEVWLGKWIPVDPTWLEVGSLDATHIPLTRSAEAEVQTITISAMVVGSGELAIENEVLGGLPTDEIQLIRLTNASDANPPILQSSADQLPPGGQAILWTELDSDHFGLVNAQLSSCVGSGGDLLSIASENQTLTTRPNQTRFLIWSAQASDGLDPGYEYRCPVSMGIDGYASQSLPITISEDASLKWPALTASMERTSVRPGEPLRVYVRAPLSMAGSPIHLLEFDLHQRSIIDRNGQAAFDLAPTRLGAHTIYLFSTRGDPLSLDYDVQSNPLPTIDILGPSDSIQALDPFNVSIQVSDLDSNLSSQRLRLAWSFDQLNGETPLPANLDSIHLALTARSAGEPLLLVRLISDDGTEQARSVRPFFIYSSSDVSVSSLEVQSMSGQGWQTSVSIQRDGDVRDLRLMVGNQTWSAFGAEPLHPVLAAGANTGRLLWTDAAGRPHEKEVTLDVPVAPPTPSALSPSDPITWVYNFSMLPILLLMAGVFAALLVLALHFRHHSPPPPLIPLSPEELASPPPLDWVPPKPQEENSS